MAEMKLYELVNHYHIGTELTCAEAMFPACNEYYHLNLSEETRKMFSVMGLGMQTEQSCCGAFTVAVGIIGLMTTKEGQTDVDNMEGYQMIAELTDFMLGFYGTLHCVELQKLEIVGYENPCHAIVEALAKSWRSCWRAAGSSARQIWNKSVHDMPERGKSMSKLSQEEVQSLRSRICHRDQELISTLTPEQFLALLSYDYDTGFAAGKASAQKEILCMLAVDGMPPEKIALLLRMEAETVREILAAKQAHIEKCRKRLERGRSHERPLPIRKPAGGRMGDPSMDTRSAPAIQNLGGAGADRAIFSHSPPPLCDLPSAEDQRRIPDRGIPTAGTDRQQRRLGTAGPGRDPGV